MNNPDRVMGQTPQVRSVWLILLCMLFHVSALLVMSAYDSSRDSFPYTQPINWRQLSAAMATTNVSSLGTVMRANDWQLLGLCSVAVILVLATRHHIRSMPRFYFFILQPVIFFRGWVGLLLLCAFPFEARHLDGEWLGEHSPILISLGLWIVVSLIIAFSSFERSREKTDS